MFAAWKERARQIKADLLALWLAYRDPRTPWYARLAALLVVGYAFSPLDLIPDPIPVLGYLDDLLLVPLGILLAVRLIPAEIMAEARARVRAGEGERPVSWIGAAVIVAIWLLIAWLVVRALW